MISVKAKPTENETELRKEISNLMSDLMLQTKLIKVADEKSMIRQGERLINAHNERLKKIMTLITADKQRLLQELMEQAETYQFFAFPDAHAVPVEVIQNKLEGLS
jgi:predicted RNA binding protein with dsRBD fold (UPF0201 family)